MTGPSARSWPLSSAGRDPLGVAAVAQLAVELVDEVAAVGEDQDAAGARRLDEAERRDGLAGAGRVLEPEALARRSGPPPPRRAARRRRRTARPSPSARPARPRRAPPRPGSRPARARPRLRRRSPLPLLSPLRWTSASSAVSVPESTSTWWAESTVPSTSAGWSWLSSRSRPSNSEKFRRHATDGTLRPGVHLRQRRVERPPVGGAGSEQRSGVLSLGEERLAGELRRPLDVVGWRKGRDHRGHWRGFSHERQIRMRRPRSTPHGLAR